MNILYMSFDDFRNTQSISVEYIPRGGISGSNTMDLLKKYFTNIQSSALVPLNSLNQAQIISNWD